MRRPLFPALDEINTRVWLNELSARAGRPLTLAEVPDAELDRLAGFGFDWVWLMGVWQTGPAGRAISATRPDLLAEYRAVLPDLRPQDIAGSPYAVQRYRVHADFGGDAALTTLRGRLRQRGLRLLVDLVPNHTALDHPWAHDHPEFYVHGRPADLQDDPANYCRIVTARGPAVLAHGRDPYFPGWTDTLQLNYRHAGLRAAMTATVAGIARAADGVRCDMAMLLLPDVFLQTWGDRALPADGTAPVDTPFWVEAIAAVRADRPDFLFMAEAYWDKEWTLQQLGFDYTYDKRLYDRLHAGDAGAVRGHLHADAAFQQKSVRFLENHDEPRAACAFPPGMHQAAATIAYLVPGLRFFHDGQLEGRRAKLPVHLGRRPDEPPDAAACAYYGRLFDILRRSEVRSGSWQLLACRPAWDENPTWDRFIAFGWEGDDGRRLLAAVNFGPTQGQCYVTLAPWGPGTWVLTDLLGDARYERDGDDLATHGLYLDMPAWGHHAFAVSR